MIGLTQRIRQTAARPTATDAFVVGVYALAAALLYSRMWTDLRHGYLPGAGQDQHMLSRIPCGTSSSGRRATPT
ncbi:hypothetical protein [Kibdelosporangium persicum]|uniref:hypothetical protein n=1 Tax=Kibdelosporangium persicum TaxID=2698649 RepID=UPI0015665F38|nr:hypothetical protein [Kibdelosporangium persicum]